MNAQRRGKLALCEGLVQDSGIDDFNREFSDIFGLAGGTSPSPTAELDSVLRPGGGAASTRVCCCL